MTFTSFRFLIFAAALLFVYYRIPTRDQWILLLAASYLFYLQAGASYLFFILFTTVTVYTATRAMDANLSKFGKHAAKQENRVLMIGCLAVNFGILFFCKAGLTDTLPLGISFYCFQSTGYVVDVYRGSVKAEKNPFRLGLFVSFFPQLVQGPISKYRDLAPQLYNPHPYDGRRLSFGLQRMLWGYFKKLVIADRIAVAVAALKAPEYTGAAFLVLTVFYALQIYSDFTGGIDIALGLSQALGIDLAENFVHPFSSRNVAEYWRRWHISLGVWMKDYVFYPLSVSSPMRKFSKTARTRFSNLGKRLPVHLASFVTWAATGIWHGLTPNFLLWGMLNCFVIVASEEFKPLYARFHKQFHLRETKWYVRFEMFRTFVLMNLIRSCDLFPDISGYFRRLGSLFSGGSFRVPLLELGLSPLDYGILACGTMLMLAVSLVQEKIGKIREILWRKPLLRYVLIFSLFLATLLMGHYGIGYDAENFIYNQF